MSDAFEWAPVLRREPSGNPMPEWNAQADFSGPAGRARWSLSAWEKYAQVVLLTNEFIFVD